MLYEKSFEKVLGLIFFHGSYGSEYYIGSNFLKETKYSKIQHKFWVKQIFLSKKIWGLMLRVAVRGEEVNFEEEG